MSSRRSEREGISRKVTFNFFSPFIIGDWNQISGFTIISQILPDFFSQLAEFEALQCGNHFSRSYLLKRDLVTRILMMFSLLIPDVSYRITLIKSNKTNQQSIKRDRCLCEMKISYCYVELCLLAPGERTAATKAAV